MAKEGKVELEIREITKCPFKGVAAANSMTGEKLEGGDNEVVCRKTVNGLIVAGGRITRGPCVGEDNCPDMQTHRAVMELLRRVEQAGQLPRGCTGKEIEC